MLRHGRLRWRKVYQRCAKEASLAPKKSTVAQCHASMETGQCVNLFEFANSMEPLLDVLSGVPSTVRCEVDRYFSYLADVYSG